MALLVLAGALGFGVGYLMQASLNDLFAEPLSELVARFTESDAFNLIIASLLWGLGSGLCGLLGGGAIGYTWNKRPLRLIACLFDFGKSIHE